MVYKFQQPFGDRVDIYPTAIAPGLHIQTSRTGCLLPDDEIPNLISALQNYMSKRAKAITKAAANAR